MADFIAASGYWSDIQDAIDLASNGDNVLIPNGTFNFVDVDEDWTGPLVTVPAGVNLFGEPNETDEDGMNTEWNTVLKIPWDVPGSWYGTAGDPPRQGGPLTPYMFSFAGTGDPAKPSRFSDIRLQGYRVIDPESLFIIKGMYVNGIVDLRVDHSYLEGISGGGVICYNSSGVIDHNRIVNHEGYVVGDFSLCTVGYGVQVDRADGDVWDNDVTKVLGKYTNYSVFIEDNYFEKLRHSVASARGAHYVFRHNTIQDDFGYGSVDAHGRAYMVDGQIAVVGTRCAEIYNNTITDAVQYVWATFIRGGAGVAFNNTVGGGTYTQFIYFSNEADAEVSKCWINDWYIWGNTMLSGCTLKTEYDPLGNITEDVNYFLREPNMVDDGFVYNPYTYPHPLAAEEETPPTPNPPILKQAVFRRMRE